MNLISITCRDEIFIIFKNVCEGINQCLVIIYFTIIINAG